MFVRPELPGDRVDVRTVHTAAFGRSAEADLVDPLRATEGWLPSLSLVAEQHGTIVGHVLFSDVLLAGRPVLSLAPLGVHPDHQRAGIGTALVRTGLAIAERTDRGLVVVLGNPAYYGRFGFLSSGAQGDRPVPGTGRPLPAAAAARLQGGTDRHGDLPAGLRLALTAPDSGGPARRVRVRNHDHGRTHAAGPGPSNPYPEATAALGAPLFGHLDPLFLSVLDETCDRLRTVFGTANPLTLPLSGTGSAGMEAAFVNTVHPGDVVVVAANGQFGERMIDVASRCGAEVVPVRFPWGTPVDVEAVLAAHPAPALVAVVHAETSTGVRNDVAALAAAVHDRGDALVLADCVTSLAGIDVALDAWGVDLAYSGTQKCLAWRPGWRRSRWVSGPGRVGWSTRGRGISTSA